MISDDALAKQISDLMLDIFYRLDESCVTATKLCPTQEASVYRKSVGRVVGPIVLDVLQPLYNAHPELKPVNWEDAWVDRTDE